MSWVFEERHDGDVATSPHHVRWGPTVSRARLAIRAVIQKQPHQLQLAAVRGLVDRCEAALLRDIGRGASCTWRFLHFRTGESSRPQPHGTSSIGPIPEIEPIMARPLRIQAPGLTYHVTGRGSGHMAIFRDEDEYRRFLELLEAVAEWFRLVCHAYCLMPNHFHLVVTTPQPNLSRAIKQLNGTYAQWWDSRHERVGHVFQGRFGAQVVQDDTYLLTVCRYVVLNPVRAGLAQSPADWPWSSYRAPIGLAVSPPFLQASGLWRLLGCADAGTAARRFREFVAENQAKGARIPRDRFLGDDVFVERFKGERESAGREVPRIERESPPALATLFAGMARREERNIRAVKACALGYSIVEIARYLGLHTCTVSKIVTAVTRGQTRQNATK